MRKQAFLTASVSLVVFSGVAFALMHVEDSPVNSTSPVIGSENVQVVAAQTSLGERPFAGTNSGGQLQAVAASWRSDLYPSNWLPVGAGGSPTADGKFLHDFSYAGYLTGDTPIPAAVGANVIRTVNASTYGNGSADATTGIQTAIDQVCAGGGGSVNIGAGTFRIKPQGSATYALHLKCRDLILRGAKDAAGAPSTFIFNDEANMRLKRVIVMGDAGTGIYDSLYDTTGNVAEDKVAITSDLLLPTRVIPVTSVTGYQPSDYVMITADWSDAFRAEHGMSLFWPKEGARGLLFYRKVTAVNSAANTLSVDIPLRYRLKARDNPRVYKPRPFLANIGLENISIGMRENNVPGVGDDDHTVAGTGAYQMDSVPAVQVVLLRHGWIRNVRSFRPSVNVRDVHLQSNGIHLTASTRSITIDNVQLAKSQYKGEGGNGYLFQINGSDNLVINSVGTSGRHNFLTGGSTATGNVFSKNVSNSGRLFDDFHYYLSPANLVDGHYVNGPGYSAVNRLYDSGRAGYTATQTVFWNLRVNPASTGTWLFSDQVGWGYVIGTQGRPDGVSASDDFVEGVGIGDQLTPESLFSDQKARRDASSVY